LFEQATISRAASILDLAKLAMRWLTLRVQPPAKSACRVAKGKAVQKPKGKLSAAGRVAISAAAKAGWGGL
jgi:hypothetical protein